MSRLISLAALAALLPLAALPTSAAAQQRDSTAGDSVARALDERGLPREVAREVVERFNAPGTLRVNGSLDLVAGREVEGDVAVLDGPLTIAGHVTGTVVAVNADVTLRPGARIDGDLLVVGGSVSGKSDATIGGDLRIYRQAFYYHHDGERIVADHGNGDDDAWWARWGRRHHRRSFSDITLASAHTYNRVEGLPILVGPTIRQDFGWGRFDVSALGIMRTADNFKWDSQNLGHDASVVWHLGGRGGLLIGGRSFDIVTPVEEWHLTDTEVGLASFFLHRDYRDYWNRHGGRAWAGLFAGRDADLTIGLSDERWVARAERDPWTLFRNEQDWRANPLMDEGLFHIANATLRVDTRNDRDDPWAGWYIVADLERGSGRYTAIGTTTPGVREGTVAGSGVDYSRGFLDLRRYNRISPDAQLNMRVVLGGWLGGDELPLQRRFSVGGVGTIPGFDFRRVPAGSNDVFQCGNGTAIAGRPAQCERVALAQLEYRGNLNVHFGFFDDDGDDDGNQESGRHWHRHGLDGDGSWVLFTDAGRGWLVGPSDGERSYPRDRFPALSTFKTDIGAGLDFGALGVYVAKSLSDSKTGANFFVRARRRF